MSLDVGVVTIEYKDIPTQQVHEFLFDLLVNPHTGVDDGYEEEDWGGSWSGNGLYEFKRESLIRRAANWSAYKGINSSESAALLRWIEALPWRSDHVMLHLEA